jgi:poly(A) polymerase
VDICIFSLADMLAKQAGAPEQSEWLDLLEINRQLLDAWYNHRDEKISPPRLLDGNDLMEVLGIPPGPEVGRTLEAITEAQVEGRVRTREDAIEFVRRFIS